MPSHLKAKNQRRCECCGSVSPLTDFSVRRANPDGLDETCKKCKSIQYKEWYKNNKEYAKNWNKRNVKKRLLISAKHRAKKRQMPFLITENDFSLPETCPILGLPLMMHGDRGPGGSADSYSLDRIDQSIGYEPGNVWVISHLANSMKSFATKDQILLFARWAIKEFDK